MVISLEFLRSLVWTKEGFVPVEKPNPAHPPVFQKGDRIRLKDKNPFKGSLKCGVVYEVINFMGGRVEIEASHGGRSYYASMWFEPITWDPDADAAYNEAIAAQDLMKG